MVFMFSRVVNHVKQSEREHTQVGCIFVPLALQSAMTWPTVAVSRSKDGGYVCEVYKLPRSVQIA